jgi:hypothetical protein
MIFLFNLAWQRPLAPAIIDNTTVTRKDDIPLPDKVPPVILNLQAKNISGNSVEISWLTDEPSTSQVIWNAQSMTSETTPQKEAMVNQHLVELNNLKAKTTYFYKSRSVDQSGNEAFSEQKSFDIGKQPGTTRIDVQMYSMYVEDQPPPVGTKTYIRGQIINNGDVPVRISDVEISIKITIPGRGAGEILASPDPYPATVSPGQSHKFYAVVPNGTDPVYSITVRIVGQ